MLPMNWNQNVTKISLDTDARKLPKNYQNIQYTPEITCGALYVILMYYSPSSLGFELMLPQSTGDYTGAFTN